MRTKAGQSSIHLGLVDRLRGPCPSGLPRCRDAVARDRGGGLRRGERGAGRCPRRGWRGDPSLANGRRASVTSVGLAKRSWGVFFIRRSTT